MHQAQQSLTRCARCGQRHAPTADGCPVPDEADRSGRDGERADWRRTRDSLKTRWVVAVIAFWVSVAVLVAVLVIDERLDPVLASICLGLLIVGVWLKTRYQKHLRQDPGGD